MNFILGLLLKILQDEELTFWTFVSIMGEKQWRSTFTKGTPRLLEMINRFEGLVKATLPRLHDHLVANDV
jgi:hypothetical protein